MYRTNRCKGMCLLIAGVLISGCARTAEAPTEETVVVSDYLNEEALKQGEERQLKSYQIEEAFVGTFRVKHSAKAQFYVQESVGAYAEYEYGTMIFDELVSSTGKYVEEGETIARVHIDVSEADLMEVRLSLQRMQERVEADRLLYEEEDARLKREAYATENFEMKGVALRQYEESLEYHRQDIEAQHEAIRKMQETLEKMEAAALITEIKAPISGYIRDVEALVEGRTIPNESMIAILEPEKSDILWVSNEKNAFRYGKEVTVTCANTTEEEDFTGVVITPSQSSVAAQATDRKACIRLDAEGVAYLEKSSVNTITAKVNTVEQENAIMVKMGALEIDEEDAYATVIQDDGSFVKKKVILGGISDDCYWVLEGLNEHDRVVVP